MKLPLDALVPRDKAKGVIGGGLSESPPLFFLICANGRSAWRRDPNL